MENEHDRQEEKFFNSTRTVSLTAFGLLTAALIWLLVMRRNGQVWLYADLYLFLTMLVFISGSVFVILCIRHGCQPDKSRKWMTVLFSVLLILVLIPVWAFGRLTSTLAYHTHFIYESPGGKNTLVIIEGGFIDAVVWAYPLDGSFYEKQDNGFLSYHDLGSVASEEGIRVQWVSEDMAIVTVAHSNYQPNENSNTDDRIVVVFD